MKQKISFPGKPELQWSDTSLEIDFSIIVSDSMWNVKPCFNEEVGIDLMNNAENRCEQALTEGSITDLKQCWRDLTHFNNDQPRKSQN